MNELTNELKSLSINDEKNLPFIYTINNHKYIFNYELTKDEYNLYEKLYFEFNENLPIDVKDKNLSIDVKDKNLPLGAKLKNFIEINSNFGLYSIKYSQN